MKKIYVILNEQHKLLKQQKLLIIDTFGEDAYMNHEIIQVPISGWTRKEMDDIIQDIISEEPIPDIVFATSIPYMIITANKLGAKTHIYLRTREKLSNGAMLNTCELISI